MGAFRGYLALNGEELANTSRVIDHLRPVVFTDDTMPSPFCGCSIQVVYDDSWPGLREALSDDPYVITNAPWYTPAIPESTEFAGVWVTKIEGLDSQRVQRDIVELVCSGGAAGPHRDATREVSFTALIIACTNAGAEFGLSWLTCVLRQATARGGVPLDFYGAHPSGTAALPASLARQLTGMVVTENPHVDSLAGMDRGHQNRQASIYQVGWKMVALNPTVYGMPINITVTWDSTSSQGLVWVHAPGCTTAEACADPVVYNVDCLPPEIAITPAPVPTCGGCLPVCDLERRVYQLDSAITRCNETAVSIRVTNTGASTLTANFYLQPCGATDICDRIAPLQISGLPVSNVAVADSVSGRPYVEVAGDRVRQVGVISTPSGAPWSPTIIDHGLCWELVVETVPGSSFTTELVLQDRQP